MVIFYGKVIQLSLAVVVRSRSGIRCPINRVDLGDISAGRYQLQESLKLIGFKITRKQSTVHTCCCWLPAYRPMEAGPNDARVGAVPSSCQLIVDAVPAGKLVEAMGSVTFEGGE